MSLFKDRRDAGRQLASALERYRKADVLVLAIPRGGVPVAYEVASALGAPLDVFVVRKLRAPDHRDEVVGALASGGLMVLNDDIVRRLGVDAEVISAVAREETHELVRREHAYRGGRPPSVVADKTVLLIDDGAETGATLRAAIRALRKGVPDRIVVAAPVAAPGAASLLAGEADEVVCVATPQTLTSIAEAYERFEDTTEDEARGLLAEAFRTEHQRIPPPVDLRGELSSSNRR